MSKSQDGWLKIKLHNQTKWHRRYGVIDWDKAVLFIASKPDTRYRYWIKLSSDIIINDYESLLTNESNLNNNNLLINTIEIKTDNGTAIHFLQTDEKSDYDSWLLAVKQAAYSRIGGGIFGQSLEDTYKYSRDKTSLVPLIVRQCCEYLLEYGSTSVGLFRVPGKQSVVKELRDIYDRGLDVELKSCHSPATISSLLKIYLQSLPEPIIPTKKFDDFLEIGSRFKYNQTNDVHRLKQLIESSLLNLNYAILAHLCLFLKKLTEYAPITKMDTDNLAVVFGNNLIRPIEELDLNMIKGHNYNLIPLIKVLIDQSEFLFSNNNSIQQLQDSYEQTNKSITKSSGFSSFSSLLSSNEHPITVNDRSASMASICMAAGSSFDSVNLSNESQSELDDIKRRPILFVENSIHFTYDQETDENHYETFQTSTHSEDECYQKNQSNVIQKRFASTDLLDTNAVHERMKHDRASVDNILFEKKINSGNCSRPVSTISVPTTIHKMEKYSSKKSFATKFGKSFSSLKSSMSKVLQSHISSNETDSQTIDPSLSSNPQLTRKSLDNHLPTNSLSKLQNDIEILKELLDKKDFLINELTRTSHEEYLNYEKTKLELIQQIEQLQNENSKLKKQLNMQ